jgi:hypothetical protein
MVLLLLCYLEEAPLTMFACSIVFDLNHPVDVNFPFFGDEDGAHAPAPAAALIPCRHRGLVEVLFLCSWSTLHQLWLFHR